MDESTIGEDERIQERVQQDGEGGPLQDVFFGYDSFELSEEARQTLQANADWLQNNAEVKVEIEGHCDERERQNTISPLAQNGPVPRRII